LLSILTILEKTNDPYAAAGCRLAAQAGGEGEIPAINAVRGMRQGARAR